MTHSDTYKGFDPVEKFLGKLKKVIFFQAFVHSP